MRRFLAVFLFVLSTPLAAEIVDTRTEAYKNGTFHLAQAQQAMSRAIKELKKAEAQYDFPGLNITKMIGQIQQVEKTATLILTPERRRLEAKTLVPSGTFFQPIE